MDSQVVRIKPYQYIHVLDNNTNVTRTEIGPKMFTRQEHEKLITSPLDMVVVPPQHYVIIADPVKLDDGKIVMSKFGQPVLRLGDEEIRFAGEPFPLFFGERQLGAIMPLKTVQANSALHLIATRDFSYTVGEGKDAKEVKRRAGDEWLFKGPGTYIPRIDVTIKGPVNATVILKGEALRLKAIKTMVDRTNTKRECGEEWLVRTPGAYLPSVDEAIVKVVTGHVVTITDALKLRAEKNFVDVYGKQRKVGEEWLVTSDMTDSHIPDVYETILGTVSATVLGANNYCVIIDPVDAKGRQQLGRKEVRRGERTFFLQPGERLEDNKVKNVYVLTPEEALLLRALEEYDGHQPGDRWMVHGPCTFVPSVQVEIIEKRSAIPLDKNEGVYVRDIKTGRIRSEMGKSYMLKASEELVAKELPDIVEQLLAKDVRLEKDAVVPVGDRNKTRVVTLRLPHNSACQVYDYKAKKSRVVFGPDLIALDYDEQFTILSLSGGKPKVNHKIKSLVLLLGPDFMTDIIQVDTADHAKLQITLSYKYHFDATPENGSLLFKHPDFVGDVCKTMASKIRSTVASNNFDMFHKNSAQIIQNAIFGDKSVYEFPSNSLKVSGVDVQSVEPVDQKTRDSLMKTVQLAIEITTQSQQANARHEAEKLDQEAQGLLRKKQLEENAKAEKIKEELLRLRVDNNTIEATGRARAEAKARTEAARIEAEASVEQAKLKAQAIKIKIDTEMELQKMKQDFNIEHQKKVDELELQKKKTLTEIESNKFKAMVGAIGPKTISAMARAGPELQAKLLSGLGLKSVMITDGSSPINLFNAASGLIATPKRSKQ